MRAGSDTVQQEGLQDLSWEAVSAGLTAQHPCACSVSSGSCRGVTSGPDSSDTRLPLPILPSGTGSLRPSCPEGSDGRLSRSFSLNTSLELFLTAAPAENQQRSATCGRSHRSAGRRSSSSYGAGRGRGPKCPRSLPSGRGSRVRAGGRQSIAGGEPARHAGGKRGKHSS